MARTSVRAAHFVDVAAGVDAPVPVRIDPLRPMRESPLMRGRMI
jgi:hypothetical protein